MLGSFSNAFPRLAGYSSSIVERSLCSFSKLRDHRPQIHQQVFPRSFSRTASNLAASAIRDDLKLLPIDKWEWVIYRCTYADDQAWATFRARVEAKSRKQVARSKAPEIADRLEWTWVEDATSLEGISTTALRERFRARTASEVARQKLEDHDPATSSRFRYFIKIDEEVMQNLTGFLASKPICSRKDFIKFVDADWQPSVPAEQQDDEWEEETWEPVEGCTEKDVRWMRISPIMLHHDFYEVLEGDDMAWYLFYERPPSIVVW